MDHDKADVDQKKIDLKRAQELYDAKLIAAQDFEAKKVLYDLAVSTLNSSITTCGRLNRSVRKRPPNFRLRSGKSRNCRRW